MALAYGTAYGSWATGSGNPLTYNFTCGATAKVLVVYIANATTTARTTDAPTYNGVTMTQAGTAQAGSAECNVEIWYLLNPPTGSSYQVSIDNDGSLTLFSTCHTLTTSASAATFGTPQQTGVSTATPSLTINSVPAGGACVAVLGHGYKDPPTARSGTVILETDQGAWISNAQYILNASLGNQTLSWTFAASDDVAMIMAAFQEGAANLTVSEIETLSVTDTGAAAVSAQVTIQISKTETLTVSDTAAGTENVPVQATETLTAADTASAAVSAPVTLAISEIETLSVADDETIDIPIIKAGYYSLLSFWLGGAGGLTVVAPVSVPGLETLSVADTAAAAVSTQPTIEVSEVETLSVTDTAAAAVGASQPVEVSEVETLSVIDSAEVFIQVQVALEASLLEELAVTDNATAYIALITSLIAETDSVNLSDAVQAAVSSPVTIQVSEVETLAVTDARNVMIITEGELYITATDNVAVNDASSISGLGIGGGADWIRRRRRM